MMQIVKKILRSKKTWAAMAAAATAAGAYAVGDIDGMQRAVMMILNLLVGNGA